MRNAYTAHRFLTDPARPSAQLWRLGLGVAIVVAIYYALGFAYFNLLAELVTQREWPALSREISEGSTPRGMIALLGSFAMIVIALAVVLPTLHGRGIFTLIGPLPRAASDFFRTGVALSALGFLLWLLPEPETMATVPNLPMLRWLALLPLTLPLLFLQISAEELGFRGYLQSQLAARLPHPAVWLIVPSLLFGMLHYDPATQGDNAPWFVLIAALFGLAAADLTARSGTLGPALALHFAINIGAILIAAPQGALNGLALGHYPFALDDTAARAVWLPYDVLMLFCSWLTARLALGR
ncbi:CPBP family intramembrane glutamic endopeptidase [Aquicoccus porphyridii]|uniref:CPBP family intramembrane glutamic endopeptidase n=1 Tax=Aquicoccus porphyridii TaxID=1852029 RepID=UPI00273D0182|nr:type II CAAX endopeptidase family protein [Aquicoccus porphyridii]